MLVKEEDANKLFCPLISGANQYIVCKGSHCMAWRWTSDMPEAKTVDLANMAQNLGYCGLAGVITLPPMGS